MKTYEKLHDFLIERGFSREIDSRETFFTDQNGDEFFGLEMIGWDDSEQNGLLVREIDGEIQMTRLDVDGAPVRG